MSYYPPAPPPRPPFPPPFRAGPPGPPKKTWTGRILLGVLITVGATLLGALGFLVPGSNGGLIGLGLLVPVVCLVVGIVLVCIESTRPWGLGMIIGFFVMLVVGAGACVALITGLNSTNGAL
ncbi:MAG: hypothetical protein M3Y19_03395 [Actinomycetota bacterium]|nr:hypothetical protein [Actinomycetota bacterium]